MRRLVAWELDESVARPFAAFARGFHRLISGPLFGLFQPEELQALTVGQEVLDFHELEAHCEYKGYTASSKVRCV